MNCDICGEIVDRRDDATHLEAVAYKVNSGVLVSRPRHIRCSPSRAQYIVHDCFSPVEDNRQAYDKRCLPDDMRKSREVLYTSAWETLQNEEID